LGVLSYSIDRPAGQPALSGLWAVIRRGRSPPAQTGCSGGSARGPSGRPSGGPWHGRPG